MFDIRVIVRQGLQYALARITGAHPFDGVLPSDLSRLVLAGRSTPLSAQLDGAPLSWQAFFERALSTDASRRAHSADLFFSELAALLTRFGAGRAGDDDAIG